MPDGKDVANPGKRSKSNTATTMERRFVNERVRMTSPYVSSTNKDPLNIVGEAQDYCLAV
jgi:hypothetical protein